MEEVPDSAQRKALIGKLVGDESFEYFIENGSVKWRSYAQKIIESPAETNINDQKD
jgi:hypothetical protein